MLAAATARARALEDENKQLVREAATNRRASSLHTSSLNLLEIAPFQDSTTPSMLPPPHLNTQGVVPAVWSHGRTPSGKSDMSGGDVSGGL